MSTLYGVILEGTADKPAIEFVYLFSLLSNTHFITEQNGSRWQVYYENVFRILNGNYKWPTLFVKSGFCFKLT